MYERDGINFNDLKRPVKPAKLFHSLSSRGYEMCLCFVDIDIHSNRRCDLKGGLVPYFSELHFSNSKAIKVVHGSFKFAPGSNLFAFSSRNVSQIVFLNLDNYSNEVVAVQLGGHHWLIYGHETDFPIFKANYKSMTSKEYEDLIPEGYEMVAF